MKYLFFVCSPFENGRGEERGTTGSDPDPAIGVSLVRCRFFVVSTDFDCFCVLQSFCDRSIEGRTDLIYLVLVWLFFAVLCVFAASRTPGGLLARGGAGRGVLVLGVDGARRQQGEADCVVGRRSDAILSAITRD